MVKELSIAELVAVVGDKVFGEFTFPFSVAVELLFGCSLSHETT